MILEEIEQDEIAAHSLDEVTSKKDSQALQLQSTLDQSGRVRIPWQRQKGKLPANTEELHQKLRIEANAWLMVASKMRNKAFLQNLEQRHFDRYTDYLLGVKCYNMQIPGPTGEKVPLLPPWHIILDYEFEMRKKAVKMAQKDNRPLHEVLREVTENTELKESLGVGETPWLFRDDGESSWASTSAELLASLVALKVLPLGSMMSGAVSSHLLHCGGGTDNKAAGSLSVRKLSTKLPVMVVLMEYLSQCESRISVANLIGDHVTPTWRRTI